MIAERKLQDAIDQKIQHDRKWKRYRRLGYYFFEREIQSDIKKSLESDFISTHHLLLDPEYQACIARSCLWKNTSWWILWDDVTFLINNYLFSQDIFVIHENSDVLLSEQLIQILQKGNNPWFLNDSSTRMSDVIMQCRRTRDDIQLIQSIVNWSHTYKSLLKTCAEYIGKYAYLPRLFEELWLIRSPNALVSLLEESTQQQLQWLLKPKYQVICHLLVVQDIQAYGYINIATTPYSTLIGRLWQWLAHIPWYTKIFVTMSIVLISWWFWWWALIILPIVRWLLAISRSVYQYLELLKNLLSQWYIRYSDYNTTYINLYDAMIDPDQSTKDSVAAQHTMIRRYDIIPFSGHELVWDATQYAKILYDAIMWSLSHTFESSHKDIAMISAVHDRWTNNNLSLLIVKDGQYPEQVLYRFEKLLQLASSLVWSLVTDTHYTETYDIIDEQISTKKHDFRFWTFRNALMDGVTVALSSGILWWIWSYLRNRWVAGTSTFASGPSIVGHNIAQSDSHLLLDNDILIAMKTVMKTEDVTRFVDTIMHDNQSTTLWDTMVKLFWEKQWNIYTNNLMDHRWRIDNQNWDSMLFNIAFNHNIPLSSHDAWWNSMMQFLHRIYGYKNLQNYESLIDKQWLSNTLYWLKNGSLSLDDFAKLDIKQREIVSQAMFYYVPQDSLWQLFLYPETTVVDTGITTFVRTWWNLELNTTETGNVSVWTSNSLSIWQKILDILGWSTHPLSGNITIENIGTSLSNTALTGDVGFVQSNTWNIITQSWDGFKGRWRQRFTGAILNVIEPANDFIESGYVIKVWSWYTDTVVNNADVVSSSWWMDHLFSRWHNFTHQSYTITETGNKVIETGWKVIEHNPLVIETGYIEQSGSLSHGNVIPRSWWFEQFVIWIKGTASVNTGSIDISGLVNTGQIEHILSGINPTDLQEQATWFTEQIHSSSDSLRLSQFTFPVIKKDKKVD
jgi:hypothetical protein